MKNFKQFFYESMEIRKENEKTLKEFEKSESEISEEVISEETNFILNKKPLHYDLSSPSVLGSTIKVNNKDIIACVEVSTVDNGKYMDRYILRPDSWVKSLGKGIFHCYSYRNKAMYLVKIDSNLKLHFVDDNKTEDDENPVFEKRGYKLTTISVVSKEKGESGDSDEIIDFNEFKKTEFGKLVL